MSYPITDWELGDAVMTDREAEVARREAAGQRVFFREDGTPFCPDEGDLP